MQLATGNPLEEKKGDMKPSSFISFFMFRGHAVVGLAAGLTARGREASA